MFNIVNVNPDVPLVPDDPLLPLVPDEPDVPLLPLDPDEPDVPFNKAEYPDITSISNQG